MAKEKERKRDRREETVMGVILDSMEDVKLI